MSSFLTVLAVGAVIGVGFAYIAGCFLGAFKIADLVVDKTNSTGLGFLSYAFSLPVFLATGIAIGAEIFS